MTAAPIFASRQTGSRIATRVRIREGAYAGVKGMVVRVYHKGAVEVRLHHKGREIAVHFAMTELEVV